MFESGSRRRTLPAEFVLLNGLDDAWLRGLPALVDLLAARWSLTVEDHFPGIAYNYVAPATRVGPDRRPTACVLKVSRRLAETRNEIAALRLWEGRGAARLIEESPEIGALLIERVEPGTMLVDLAETDDHGATLVAAGSLRRLWEPAVELTDLSGLRPLSSWCAAYDRNRAALSRGADGFPAALFRRADALRRDLLASSPGVSALHGDMHHFNVLRGDRGWLAIDPKGLAGDRHFDVCQFFRNPRDRATAQMNRRRLDVFCAELGLDRQRVKDWCLVHAVLDACWDFEGPLAREGGGGFSHEPNRPRRTAAPGARPWQRAVARAEAALSF
jgi:streptomycin 6-kinase